MATVVLSLIIDQATKALAIYLIEPLPATVAVLPVLNLVLLFNPGVTFGMLSGIGATAIGPWLLFALSLVGCAMLAWLVHRVETGIERHALGAAIGGAFGNALDRTRQGAVTDFLDFHYGGWHWPAFNLADVAIVCGITLYMVVGLRARRLTGPHSPSSHSGFGKTP